MKGWKKTFQSNGTKKKAGVAILISDKIHFKVKEIRRDKEGHYIFINGTIHPNSGAPNFIKTILQDHKSHTNPSILIVGDFNTPLSPLDMSTGQRINRETSELSDMIQQMDLIDLYRIFHHNNREYSFYSAPHRTFSKINHILGHRRNLHKYKKIEIISCILSDHSAIKLNINTRISPTAYKKTWRLNSILLKNERVKEEIKKEIKAFLELNDNDNTTQQNLWDTLKAVLRGNFIALGAHIRKTERAQVNDLTLQLKHLRGNNR